MLSPLMFGILVAPFTGAWIEIPLMMTLMAAMLCRVAPFTGAWIEITIAKTIKAYWVVAPFTGAWIEIVRFV